MSTGFSPRIKAASEQFMNRIALGIPRQAAIEKTLDECSAPWEPVRQQMRAALDLLGVLASPKPAPPAPPYRKSVPPDKSPNTAHPDPPLRPAHGKKKRNLEELDNLPARHEPEFGAGLPWKGPGYPAIPLTVYQRALRASRGRDK